MPEGTRFHRIARLAAGLFDVPAAAVARVDGDEIRILAAIGAEMPATERAVTAWARRIVAEGMTVVPDVRPEAPLSGMALAGAATSPVRFVAGMPVVGPDGEAAGAVVVVDRLPRPDLGPNERALLRDLAALAAEGLSAPAPAPSAAQGREEVAGYARLLSAANHDLRQPFQAMHLFLHLLRAKLVDPGQIELSDRLEQAMHNGEAMLSAVLDLAALEAGRVRPEPERFRVAEVLENLTREFERRALDKGLRLRYVPTSLEGEADAALVERVLRQFVANAVRVTARGSVLLGARRRAGRIALEVWDTGPGVPEAERTAIWEPFHQIAGPDLDRGGHLGLGLTIARDTARLIGGTVEQASRPGRGGVFRLLIPGADRTPAAPRVVPAAERNPIVVIEDDPVQLMAVRMILEGWGCTVIATPTRERALDAIAQHGPPSLVLSDLRLRGSESGLDAVDAVRRAAGIHLPAILMTGDTGPEQVKAAREADASLLQKPFGPEHLRTAVEAATGWTLVGGQ
jgi:signal transduction histidine kinase/CheY-like chemotaxis protein